METGDGKVLTLPVLNIAGEEVGTFEIDENVLGGKVRRRLMHDAVVMYQANQRTGTVKTKTRAEVAGSTKKLFRQKGTGNARCGSRKNPLWRGGGVIFGPQPRDYRKQMPQKARQAALKSALLAKMKDEETILVDQLELADIKTKQIAGMLRNLKVSGSCLLAIEQNNENIWKSARNIDRLNTKQASEINAYDVLHPRKVIITKPALEKLIESFQQSRQKDER